MTKTGFRKLSLKAAVIASVSWAFAMGGVRESSGVCGGYCEARQVRAICHRAVTAQELETHQRDAEFEKCKSDPLSYLIEPVWTGVEVGLE